MPAGTADRLCARKGPASSEVLCNFTDRRGQPPTQLVGAAFELFDLGGENISFTRQHLVYVQTAVGLWAGPGSLG